MSDPSENPFAPDDVTHLRQVRSSLYRDGFIGFLVGGVFGEGVLRLTLRYDSAKEKIDKATAYKTIEARRARMNPQLPQQALGNTQSYMTSNGHVISRQIAVKNRRSLLVFGFASAFAFLGSLGRGKLEVMNLYDVFKGGNPENVEQHLRDKYNLPPKR